MQDKTPAAIVCSACSQIIVHAHKVEAYRERDIQSLIAQHKCSIAMQSKRDFEGEVR